MLLILVYHRLFQDIDQVEQNISKICSYYRTSHKEKTLTMDCIKTQYGDKLNVNMLTVEIVSFIECIATEIKKKEKETQKESL